MNVTKLCQNKGNLFIYQTRESSLVLAGFLTASTETVIYEACLVMGELWWDYSAGLAWRKGKCSTILPSFPTLFLCSRQVQQSIPTLVPPLKQRLYKSQFLKKQSCHKPCWDQAGTETLLGPGWDKFIYEGGSVPNGLILPCGGVTGGRSVTKRATLSS